MIKKQVLLALIILAFVFLGMAIATLWSFNMIENVPKYPTTFNREDGIDVWRKDYINFRNDYDAFVKNSKEIDEITRDIVSRHATSIDYLERIQYVKANTDNEYILRDFSKTTLSDNGILYLLNRLNSEAMWYDWLKEISPSNRLKAALWGYWLSFISTLIGIIILSILLIKAKKHQTKHLEKPKRVNYIKQNRKNQRRKKDYYK